MPSGKVLAGLACLLLASCGTAGQNEQTSAFSEIAQTDAIQATGTEPFWNVRINAGTLTYTTPEDQVGTRIPVERFAGNSGLAFNGTLAGQQLDLLVTKGDCSDGMSDRRYSFTATLRIGEEQRSGCAWSDKQPFTGPAAP
jgi:uncharacterized membrane protein